MVWLDPANWSDTKAELKMMEYLATHFAVPLQLAGFNQDVLKKEWPKLKQTIQHFHKGINARKVWEKIFNYRMNALGQHKSKMR